MDEGFILEAVGKRAGLGCVSWPVSPDLPGYCSERAIAILSGEARSIESFLRLLDADAAGRVATAASGRADCLLQLGLKNSRWIELRLIFDATDLEPRWHGTIADITHRVVWPQVQDRTEDIYRILAENSPAMLWMGDAVGKCIFLNTALREFWGIDPQDLSTFDWSSTTHPDDIEKLATPFMKAMAAQEAFRVEARYRRADGVFRTMRTEARPRFDPVDGTFLGMSGINIDITDRLEAEERTAESNRLRNAVMQVSPDAIVTADAAGRFVDLNPGAERVFCLHRSEVIGQPMDNLIVPKIHRRKHAQGMKRYLETGETSILGRSVEMSALRADGSEFPAEIAVVRIPDSDPPVFTAFIRDISARKAAEEHTRMLMGELNHRTKNILSVVQAVARQTARHSNATEFLSTFNSRLLGLGASNDLLVKNDWTGVELSDLLGAQLSHLDDAVGTRLVMDGPSIRIEPKAAQTLGMAIHELSTNSLKYGALARPEGRVDLSWEVSGTEGGHRFSMAWRESGLQGVTAPDAKGFGHSVIVGMVAAALDAEVDVAFEDSGFQWWLRSRSDAALILPDIEPGP